MVISRLLLKSSSRLFSSQIQQANIIYKSEQVANLIGKQSDCLQVIDNYINDNEYNNFLKEIDGFMKRKRYEYSHWDDVC